MVSYAFERSVLNVTVANEGWSNRLGIHELLVLEDYRGKGVGKMLIEKAKQVTQGLNCRAIVLETQTNNSAVEFYKKRGKIPRRSLLGDGFIGFILWKVQMTFLAHPKPLDLR